MKTLLLTTQTVGAAWRTGFNGMHLFTVEGLPVGATVALQFLGSDGVTWIDMDATGSTAVTWTSSGGGAAWTSSELTYRFVATAAGALVQGFALTGARESVLQGIIFV